MLLYTKDIIYFGSSECRFFSLRIRKQYEVGIEHMKLKERKTQENGSHLLRGKFSSFPDFITPLTAIES